MDFHHARFSLLSKVLFFVAVFQNDSLRQAKTRLGVEASGSQAW